MTSLMMVFRSSTIFFTASTMVSASVLLVKETVSTGVSVGVPSAPVSLFTIVFPSWPKVAFSLKVPLTVTFMPSRSTVLEERTNSMFCPLMVTLISASLPAS